MKSELQRRYALRQEGLTTGRVMFGNVIIVDVHRPETDWKFSLPLLRLREIEWVITSRHGRIIPDPFGTEDVDLCLAYARAVEASKTPQDLVEWSRRWMNDIGVSLASGMNPLMVAVQQGSQIATIYEGGVVPALQATAAMAGRAAAAFWPIGFPPHGIRRWKTCRSPR